jgi:hypothetical protein
MRFVPKFHWTFSSARRIIAIGAIAVNIVAMTTLPSAGAAPPDTISTLPVLATSISTAAGTWAAVPMGHLDQPLNTFWQLFFRPTGRSSWTDVTSSLATATNGGLLLTGSNGQTLDVGIRPSNLLTFSSIVSFPVSGPARATGVLPSGLVNVPSALALNVQSGSSLALVNSGNDIQVVASSRSLFTWHTLATQQSLASSVAGQACGLKMITAVGYHGSQALVGGNCNQPGRVGIFSPHGNFWRLVGPTLPQSLDHGKVHVLGFQSSPSGISALLSVASTSGTNLVAAWATDNGRWTISHVLPLSASWRVTSVGASSATGIFVLLTGPHGSVRANILSGPTSSWHQLPSLPIGTATLVSGPANQVHALVANDTAFADWMFAPSSNQWIKGQRMTVPIQFGSSG